VAKEFLAAASTFRLGAVYDLVVNTGLRRGEVSGLRWEDVNFDKREVIPRVQLTEVGGHVIEGPIKTEAGQDRVISLNDATVDALMAWKLQQESDRDVWQGLWVDSGRVFTMENGRALRPAYVTHAFDAIVKKAKLSVITFHGLRHLHASLLLNAGVPIAVVSKRLGHSTISVTVDLYGHLMRDADRQAADAVSLMLENGSAHKSLTNG
jgi:integrase